MSPEELRGLRVDGWRHAGGCPATFIDSTEATEARDCTCGVIHAPALLASVDRVQELTRALLVAREFLDAAPHAPLCAVVGGYDGYPCNCWKRDALASIDAALNPAGSDA
jgi:hypothetical protein